MDHILWDIPKETCTASNQNERTIIRLSLVDFYQRLNHVSVVLFIQAYFVKLKFNLHYFAMGHANIGVGGGGGGG